ncbi:MAG: hypothetical protein HQL77_03860 [Magnetococcales bacterium]|nr:hypothetical protein [Magnetococcales bacterium]
MAMIATNSIGHQQLTGKSDTAIKSMSDTFKQLAGGLKAGSNFENAALVAIADRFTAQVKGTNLARIQVNDGIAVTQIAGDALNTIADAVQQLQGLATQGANATLNTADRQALQQQVSAIQDEIQATITGTTYNDHALLASNQGLSFQAGPNAGNVIQVPLQDLRGTVPAMDLSTQGGAETALQAASDVLKRIGELQGSFGASEQQLTAASENLSQSSEIQTVTGGRILNADMADRASNSIANSIRVQAGLALQLQSEKLSGARVQSLLQ